MSLNTWCVESLIDALNLPTDETSELLAQMRSREPNHAYQPRETEAA